MNFRKHILLGSRGSRLALIQAEMARGMIRNHFPEYNIEIVVIRTEGDIDHESPLSGFGGRGAFVRSIETALLKREISIAVHSLKDLPSRLPEGLALGASPVREDPRDALVASAERNLASIPAGSILATGSDRRRIQLQEMRPDLAFCGIRGNIESRIRRIGQEGIDGVVLACSGLKRLGLESRATQIFEPEEVLPAPCQGALGLERREEDTETARILGSIDDLKVRVCVDTERAFIAELGLGCHAPVGALARLQANEVHFTGLVGVSEGGVFRKSVAAEPGNAEEAARNMAREFREMMG
ncbi:MAG: hydroxymethylbilane synthase [Candidatus Latescibacterota bacterium]